MDLHVMTEEPPTVADRDASFGGLLQTRRRAASEAERAAVLDGADRMVLPLALSLARLCARLDAQAAYVRAEARSQ